MNDSRLLQHTVSGTILTLKRKVFLSPTSVNTFCISKWWRFRRKNLFEIHRPDLAKNLLFLCGRCGPCGPMVTTDWKFDAPNRSPVPPLLTHIHTTCTLLQNEHAEHESEEYESHLSNENCFYQFKQQETRQKFCSEWKSQRSVVHDVIMRVRGGISSSSTERVR